MYFISPNLHLQLTHPRPISAFVGIVGKSFFLLVFSGLTNEDAFGIVLLLSGGVAAGKIPTRISKAQRVVKYITITVVALAVFGLLDKGVGAENMAYKWIIHPAIHVYKAKLV